MLAVNRCSNRIDSLRMSKSSAVSAVPCATFHGTSQERVQSDPVWHDLGSKMIRGRRRLFLACLCASLAGVRLSASGPDLAPLEQKIDRILSRARGQVGLSLIHIESGATLAVRGDQRFPMASVYKLPIAIELL